MDRRHFIRASLATAAAASLPADRTAAALPSASKTIDDPRGVGSYIKSGLVEKISPALIDDANVEPSV